MSGSLKPDLNYLNKLHLVEKGTFVLAKCTYISVKNRYRLHNTHQLNKTYKSVKAFTLNTADFPILIYPGEAISACISVSSY